LTFIKIGDYGKDLGWQDIHMIPENSIKAHLDVGGKPCFLFIGAPLSYPIMIEMSPSSALQIPPKKRESQWSPHCWAKHIFLERHLNPMRGGKILENHQPNKFHLTAI